MNLYTKDKWRRQVHVVWSLCGWSTYVLLVASAFLYLWIVFNRAYFNHLVLEIK